MGIYFSSFLIRTDSILPPVKMETKETEEERNKSVKDDESVLSDSHGIDAFRLSTQSCLSLFFVIQHQSLQ